MAAIFIIIPDIHGERHYIPPFAIKRMIEGDTTRVLFLENNELKEIEILLTADEMHDRMIQINKEQDQDFFGPFNNQ